MGGRELHEIPSFDGKWKEAEKERFLNMVGQHEDMYWFFELTSVFCHHVNSSGQLNCVSSSYSPVQDREGAPDEPIIMNPLRHNLPAHIRNAEDLKSL